MPTGAELLLRGLMDRGVEVLYMNPGTDSAPIQRAIEVAQAAGEPAPRLVLCPHEIVALAAAHAHYAVTGRMQAVFVHVDVGTQNLGSMVHNAARAEASVLIIAGLTPFDESGTVPGGRTNTVHWMQDVPDQPGIVRQYVKATFNPGRASLVHETIQRAADLATAEPCGPVYVTVGREMLMESAPAPASARIAERLSAGPSREAVRRSVAEIRLSRRPVLMTTRIGRHPEAVAPFVRLAELIGARVVDQRERMNIPATHPLVAPDAAQTWNDADLVIALDAPIPWVLGHGGPGPECRVIAVGDDPFQTTMPNWAFPADLRITSSARLWVEAVLAQLEADSAAAVRFPEPAALGSPSSAGRETPIGSGRLAPDALLGAFGARLTEADRLIDEAATSTPAVARAMPRTLPATLFRSGGSGLGWSPGALLGMQVADPRPTVVVVGDGGFLFGTPVAALTALRRADVGGLIIVLHNGGYAASSRPVHELYPERRPGEGQPPATAFDAELDIAALARACGAVGVTIAGADDLAAGVDTAISRWRAGDLVVVDAHVSSPWIEADGS
jgi:acetolactate synthase-1/2/3 large subunit